MTLVVHFASMISVWMTFHLILQIWERSAEAARPKVYKHCYSGVCFISITFPPVHPAFDVLEHQPASWWHEWPRQIHRFFFCIWSLRAMCHGSTAPMQCISTFCSWALTFRSHSLLNDWHFSVFLVMSKRKHDARRYAGAYADRVLWDEKEGFRCHVYPPCLHHCPYNWVVLLQVITFSRLLLCSKTAIDANIYHRNHITTITAKLLSFLTPTQPAARRAHHIDCCCWHMRRFSL